MGTTKHSKNIQIVAEPHIWPNKKVSCSSCALFVIDMQHDYCSPGFYLDQAGYDLTSLRKPIRQIQQILPIARQNEIQVIYTQQGRQSTKPESLNAINISQKGLKVQFPKTAIQGERGWEIIPELIPQKNDIVIEKTTCSAFVSGELHRILAKKYIKHLIFCGNTIDVCVHSTLRSAVDLDYDCLLLSDCCGAVNEFLHRWSIESVKVENGIFGSVANARDFIHAFVHK